MTSDWQAAEPQPIRSYVRKSLFTNMDFIVDIPCITGPSLLYAMPFLCGYQMAMSTLITSIACHLEDSQEHIDCLVLDCGSSITSALELLLSWAKYINVLSVVIVLLLIMNFFTI